LYGGQSLPDAAPDVLGGRLGAEAQEHRAGGGVEGAAGPGITMSTTAKARNPPYFDHDMLSYGSQGRVG